MKHCHVDFETYSECDLTAHGAWVYSKHPSTRVLCCAISGLDGPDSVRLFTDSPSDAKRMVKVLNALAADEDTMQHAANSFFECAILANVLDVPVNFERWTDTLALAAAATWPQSLGAITTALPFPHDKQKSREGRDLIRKLCVPQGKGKQDKVDPVKFWDPEVYEGMYAKLCEYCVQDVVAERAVHARLKPLSSIERVYWEQDQRINWRGIKCDVKFINAAYRMYESEVAKELSRLAEITGLDNPNSPVQLRTWLNERGCELPDLRGATVEDKLKDPEISKELKEVLGLRLSASRTPPKKFLSMLSRTDRDDHRARGILTYHAASTGRAASRGVNLANLPRPAFKSYDFAVDAIFDGDAEFLRVAYGSPINVLCSAIRPALVADEGHDFVACDFASIEARKLRWFARDTESLRKVREADEQNQGSPFYPDAAAAIFGMRPDEVVKGSNEYQAGKATELASGYGGGLGALNTMSAQMRIDIVVPTWFEGFGHDDQTDYKIDWHEGDRKQKNLAPLTRDDMFKIYLVEQWRRANPGVVKLWKRAEAAAKAAVENPGSRHGVNGRFTYAAGSYGGIKYLWCKLPSGRLLSYVNPKLDKGRLRYQGVDSTTKQWTWLDTYGGKLIENVCQASSRDVLRDGMLRLEGTPYERIVLTVYDEVVSEVPTGAGSPEEMGALLCINSTWNEGLPLASEGTRLKRYWK